jgi:site-specific recombinase XerD
MKNAVFTFYVKKDKINEEGLVPIYLKIKLNASSTTLNSGFKINIDRWRSTLQLKDTRINHEKKIRAELDQLIQQLKIIEEKLKSRNTSFGANSIKDIYQKNDGDDFSNQIMLNELFEKHDKSFIPLIETKVRAEETLRKYRSLKNHVYDFLEYEYNLTDISLSQLNYEFIESFDVFLRRHKGIGNNTTVKYVQSFRRLMNLAVKYDWIHKDPFLLYDKKIKVKDAIFLKKDELESIENLKFFTKRLEVVRDIFIFGCYTGYAPVDIQKLTHDHIHQQNDGMEWIITTRTKTNIQSNVPLLPQAKTIIQKYQNHPECIETGFLLPRRSNQKMNLYLKEIADIANITKNLSSYVSRHTYAVTVILANGLSMEVLSKMLGHTNLKQTMHYGKIQDARVGLEMKGLIDKMNNL